MVDVNQEIILRRLDPRMVESMSVEVERCEHCIISIREYEAANKPTFTGPLDYTFPTYEYYIRVIEPKMAKMTNDFVHYCGFTNLLCDEWYDKTILVRKTKEFRYYNIQDACMKDAQNICKDYYKFFYENISLFELLEEFRKCLVNDEFGNKISHILAWGEQPGIPLFKVNTRYSLKSKEELEYGFLIEKYAKQCAKWVDENERRKVQMNPDILEVADIRR